MKISKITIKSLFGIKEWSGDGKNIELVGDNGTGKTCEDDVMSAGFVFKFPRTPEDDACIVETYMR